MERPDRGAGPGDQPLPRPGPAGRPPVRLLDAGRRLPAPRHRWPAALRRRPRRAGAASRARRPRSRTATCSPSASRGPSSGSGSPGEAPTTRAAPRRGRPSSTRCASCSRPPLPARDRRSATRRSSPRPVAGAWPSRSSLRDRAQRGRAGARRGRRRRRRPRSRRRHPRPDRRPPGPARLRTSIGGSARPAQPPARARADACAEAVRALDPRGVRPLPLPLVRRPRAEARSGSVPRTSRLTAAQIAHQVLERLYAEPPGPERPAHRPRPCTAWRTRARELIAEVGPERLPPRARRHRRRAAPRRGAGARLPRRRGRTPRPPFLPDPSWPRRASASTIREKGALPLGSGGVHGQIDRIDLGPGGEALVQDYKSGGKVDGGTRDAREARQAPAAALPARRPGALGTRPRRRPLPAAGRQPATAQPKGLLRKELAEELGGLDPRPKDHLDDEAFERRARRGAGRRRRRSSPRSRRATVIRDPIGGSCPDWCALPADLPARARAPRGRARSGRGGRGGMSLSGPKQQARGGRASATATSSCEPAPGPARRRVLVDRFCAAALDPDGGRRAHPRLHLHRAGSGPAATPDPRRALGAHPRGGGASGSRPCATALDATDRAWISTIHGFCRRLLASHPAAAGIDPRFRVVDEAEAERLAIRAFDSALEEMVEAGGAGGTRAGRGQPAVGRCSR